jgi:hypothetical protein
MQMYRCKAVLAVLFVASHVSIGLADTWLAPTPGVYASDHGEYWVETTIDGWKAATATLQKYDRDHCRQVVWRKDLGYIPARLLVSDRGWVVGLDRHGGIGYAHTLVVWNEDGRKLVDYVLDDLLTPEEISTFVMHSTTSRWWRSAAEFRFEHDGYEGEYDRLMIQLEWGKVITVDLRTGELSFTQAASALPEPMSGFADEAVFVYFQNGQPAGEASCAWKADGTVTSVGTTLLAGKLEPCRFEVAPDAHGRWKHVISQFGDHTTAFVLDGTFLRQLAPSEDFSTAPDPARRPNREQALALLPARSLRPRTVLIDWYGAPVLRSQLIRLYDREQGGEQVFHIIGSHARDYALTVRFLDTQTRSVNGREMQLDRYWMRDCVVWVDRSARVVMITQSDRKAGCVRKGYEDLWDQ